MTNTHYTSTRLARSKSKAQVDSLLSLSTIGVAISTLVILLSLSIILAFKERVSSHAYSQTGHISLYPYGYNWMAIQNELSYPPELGRFLQQQSEVNHVYPVVQQMAMLKTETDFASLVLYGVDSSFRHPFYLTSIIQGELPQFNVSPTYRNPIVLPSSVATKMRLKIGEKVRLYFFSEGIKVRVFYLSGIYNSSGLDKMPALCSSQTLQRLSGAPPTSYSRALIVLNNGYPPEEVADSLSNRLRTIPQFNMNGYGMSAASELLPDLFVWLSLLDSNVVFLVVVMLLVGIFTMITGVIIIILDKTQQIGVLKSLGATDQFLYRVFIWIALKLIARGLMAGNLLAGMLIWIQARWSIISLAPQTYYMDSVPVSFDPIIWLFVNTGIFFVISLAIFIPLRTITRISPSQVMRFE